MNRVSDKEMGFPLALILIIGLWIATFTMVDVFYSELFPKWGDFLLKFKAVGLITVYIVIALAQEDISDELTDFFSKIWRVKHLIKDPKMTVNLLAVEIEKAVDKWIKYFNRWDLACQERKSSVAVRNNLLTSELLKDRAKELGIRIVTGKVNFPQLIWLGFYMIYVYLFSTNVFNFNQPIAYLVDVFFYISLNINNKIEGIGEFLNEANETLQNVKDEEAAYILDVLSKRIITLSHDLFLVQNALSRVNKEFEELEQK